jgi:hypothetical protein
VALRDRREPTVPGNVLLYETDEVNVLFIFAPIFDWFIDCWKYLLLPRLTDAEKLELGLLLESFE